MPKTTFQNQLNNDYDINLIPPKNSNSLKWEASFCLSYNFFMFTSFHEKRNIDIPPGKECIILIKHGKLKVNDSSQRILQPGYYFTIPYQKNRKLHAVSTAEVLWIDLLPTSLYRLSGKSMYPYFGGFFPLQHLLPIDLTTTHLRFNFLSKTILDEWFQTFLLDRLGLYSTPGCISDSLQLFQHFDHNLNIEGLCHRLKINRRSYERKFRRVIGLSPKHYWKLHRVNYVLNLMKSQKCSDLQEIIVECGYFDQSHFIREFKHITGYTPGKYLLKITNKA